MLKEFFQDEKIEYYAASPIASQFITDPAKLAHRYGKIGAPSSIVVFLCPYNSGAHEGNISRYAMARDYHLFFRELFNRLAAKYEALGKPLDFEGFSDNSPFAEVRLAASLGLGVVGENGLLINEKYGSYVFIGELVFSGGCSIELSTPCEPKSCIGCGKCRSACPTAALGGIGECLSEVSQKKKLTPDEEALLIKNRTLWGCDICQNACPMNENASETGLDFFRDNLMCNLTPELLGDRESFRERLSERAFSWRGYDTLARNLALLGYENGKN